MAIEEGKAPPAFTLKDQSGNKVALKDLKGQNVVIYFYPKDDTPGCTREACDFRDHQLLRQHGAVILGVSRDDAASHQQFADKYSLPFPLLSDPDAEFLRAIGSYGPKTMYGKTSEGVKRQTFLIGPDGKLVKSWLAVQVDGHADAVAAAIDKDLQKKGQA